jgi:HK97 family phage portal protein
METDPPLLREPTIVGTVRDWVFRCMVSLLARGNAYGLVTDFTGDGFPSYVEWLHPDEVDVADNLATHRPTFLWNGKPVAFDKLIHIPYFTVPGRVLGLSPIQAFAMTTETGLLSQTYGRDWFKNGGVPSAVLETDQDVALEQAKLIKQRFKEAAKGREPVVMGAGTKYHQISVNPAEAEYLSTLKATATQIANIYGIPPEMLGGETAGRSITYANVEQRGLDVINFGERPYLIAIEEAISKVLPEPQFVKFNVDAYNRADVKTRYEAHAIALGGSNNEPFKTVDEVRELEDLPPMPESEKPKPVAPAAPQMMLPGIDQPKNGNGQKAKTEPANQGD